MELESGEEDQKSPEQTAGVQSREVLHGGGKEQESSGLGASPLCWVEVLMFSVTELGLNLSKVGDESSPDSGPLPGL